MEEKEKLNLKQEKKNKKLEIRRQKANAKLEKLLAKKVDIKDTKLEKEQEVDFEKLTPKQQVKFKRKQLHNEYRQAFSEQIKKKEKDKINYKRALREWPSAMTKEVLKIRWGSISSLGYKFFITISFLVFSALFFFLVDLGLQHLLALANVI